MQKENIIINSIKEKYHHTDVLGLLIKTIDSIIAEFTYKTIKAKIEIPTDDKKLSEDEIKDKIIEVLQ